MDTAKQLSSMFEEFFAPHVVPQLQLGKLIQFRYNTKIS
jgi:hypothetical protein